MAMMGSDAIEVSSDTISPGNRNSVFRMVLSLTTARMATMLSIIDLLDSERRCSGKPNDVDDGRA